MDSDSPVLRRVGILGGMGPAAAIDLQAKILALTPAASEREHLPILVWNVPQVPDRVAAIRGEGPSPLPAMAEGALALEAAGAQAIAIACNTAHHWAGELRARLRVPLLHIAEAVAGAIAGMPERPRRAALLATRGTLASGFYCAPLASLGIDWMAVTEEEQARGIDPAIAAVKAADLAGARAHFARAAASLSARGADLLVLACTELPLASPGSGFEARCLDANQALAQAVVRFARGEAAPGSERAD